MRLGIRRRFARLSGAGLVVLFGVAALAPAAEPEAPTDGEWRQLDRAEVIVKTRAAPDYPWPEVRAYRRVSATPEEVTAVYADFESQAGYLPGLVESRIVRQLARNSFHVAYEYEVTGPNERYTVLATVNRAPGGYRVTWELVMARYARRLSGELRVEAFGSGALVEYTNRVDPGFFGVRLGSPKTTVRQLRETVQALAAHVERLRAGQPELLTTRVHALRSMLGQP